MRGKGVLFGLNYAHCKNGKLKGCINDVNNMSKYIQQKLHIPVDVYTDDIDTTSTSYRGIIKVFRNLAQDTIKYNLDFVWIHYSGHGSNMKDTSGDEADGMDEGLVPSDYESCGIIIDDVIHKIFTTFSPKTQILFICDACHSGSILDLKYTWDTEGQCKIDNNICFIPAKTILISGCMDHQTSADAFNVLGDGKYVGALSASILKILSSKPDKIYNAFSLLNSVKKELSKGGYKQYPCLTTNFDISDACSLIPLHTPEQNYSQPPQPLQPLQKPEPLQLYKKPHPPQLYHQPLQKPQTPRQHQQPQQPQTPRQPQKPQLYHQPHIYH